MIDACGPGAIVIPLLGDPETPAGRDRMDVIVARAEHLAVLRVLRSAPVP